MTVWSMTGNQENPFIMSHLLYSQGKSGLTAVVDKLSEFAISIDKQGEYPCDHENA